MQVKQLSLPHVDMNTPILWTQERRNHLHAELCSMSCQMEALVERLSGTLERVGGPNKAFIRANIREAGSLLYQSIQALDEADEVVTRE